MASVTINGVKRECQPSKVKNAIANHPQTGQPPAKARRTSGLRLS